MTENDKNELLEALLELEYAAQWIKSEQRIPMTELEVMVSSDWNPLLERIIKARNMIDSFVTGVAE